MANCPICGNKLGMITKAKTSDGVICARCASICPSHATMPTGAIKSFWDANDLRWQAFSSTQVLKSLMSEVITIDENNRFFVFGDVKKMKETPIVFAFSEVDSYEIETVGEKTVTKKKGGITRAVVGGVVAGPVGALVGSGTAKTETKTVGGTKITKVKFVTPAGTIKRMSSNYPIGFTQFLDRCIDEGQSSPSEPAANSASGADEILKYKNLLDAGVITKEEFEAKKAQLLGL